MKIVRYVIIQKKKEGEARGTLWKDTMIIIKRGRKVSRRKDLGRWVRERLRKDNVKIIKGRENEKSAKVLFRTKKESDKIWRK